MKQKATSKPAKSFFVDMITRDISLEDSILDLIDNSVDSAWRQLDSPPMALNDEVNLENYSIQIKLDKDSFSIKDNCGGMSLENAQNYAFYFGNPDMSALSQFSIGVYGIGMKRAAFKLGKQIEVRSTYKKNTGEFSAFVVPINVGEWLSKIDEWDFDIESRKPSAETGVEIQISDLNSAVQSRFNTKRFIENLRRTIARDYTFHLKRGFNISVNGVRVLGWEIDLSESEDFKPARIQYSESQNDKVIEVEIIGGMTNHPPASIDPEDRDSRENTHGWYVVCNGRVVLAADKSPKSGWGVPNCPRWHYQYSGFLGIVFFTCEDARELPLTTTKRSIDESSDLYLKARTKMIRVARDWVTYTNLRKHDDKEQIQNLEGKTHQIPLIEVAPRDNLKVPLVGKSSGDETTVSYQVSRKKLKLLAEAFGYRHMANYAVGEKSFDYSFKKLVGN